MEELLPYVAQFHQAYGDGGVLGLLAALCVSGNALMKLRAVQRLLPAKLQWSSLPDPAKVAVILAPPVAGALIGGLAAGAAPSALLAIALKALLAAVLGMGAVKAGAMAKPVLAPVRDIMAGRRGLKVPIEPPK